jgi:hypothetical protein
MVCVQVGHILTHITYTAYLASPLLSTNVEIEYGGIHVRYVSFYSAGNRLESRPDTGYPDLEYLLPSSFLRKNDGVYLD